MFESFLILRHHVELLLLLLLLSLVLYLILAFCSFPGQLVSVNIPLLCRSWSASQCFVFYCVFSFGLAGEWLCGWWSDWGGVAVDGGGGVCGGTCNFVDNGLWWTTHVARCILHKLSCAMFINNNRTLFHLRWKGNLENMKKSKNIITVIVPNTCIQWIIRSLNIRVDVVIGEGFHRNGLVFETVWSIVLHNHSF